MRGRNLVLLTLLLAAPARAMPAQRDAGPPPVVRVVGRVTVVARPAELPLGMALADQADGTIDWPGLGRVATPAFSLIAVRGDADYARFSRGRAPQWGGAITIPSAHLILLRTDAGDPMRLLRHELAHLALHTVVRGRVPRWFDEGYATWAAREFDRLDALDLYVAVAGGTPLSLTAVDHDLASPGGNPSRAYSLAATAVLALARHHPSGSLAPLLDLLREGRPFDEAVLRTTGRTVDNFEETWTKDVRHQYGAIAWGLGLLPWVLVFGLVLVGSALRRRRDAPRRLALNEGWTLPVDEPDGPEDAPEPAPAIPPSCNGNADSA